MSTLKNSGWKTSFLKWPLLWGDIRSFSGGVNFCWSDLKLRYSFGKPGPPKPMPRHRKTNLFTNIQEYPTTLTKYNTLQKTNLPGKKNKNFFLGHVSFTSFFDGAIYFALRFRSSPRCHVRGHVFPGCSMLGGPGFWQGRWRCGSFAKT